MTLDDTASPAADCLEIQRFLPWVANGTLEPADLARTEAHLVCCVACRAELEACLALGAAVAADGPSAPKPHPRELARLLAKIDHAEEQARRAWPRRLAAWRGPASWQATPRPLRLLLAAQLGGLAVLAVLLARPAAPGPGAAATFRTLAAAADHPRVERRLRVMFHEDTTEAALRALLLPLEARIVGGPSPIGLYTLTVPGGEAAASEAMVLAHLRARPEVRFVEPLEPESRP